VVDRKEFSMPSNASISTEDVVQIVVSDQVQVHVQSDTLRALHAFEFRRIDACLVAHLSDGSAWEIGNLGPGDAAILTASDAVKTLFFEGDRLVDALSVSLVVA